MNKEQALEQLKRDRELCNFNPSTGESEPIDEDCRKSAEALDYAIKVIEDMEAYRQGAYSDGYNDGYEKGWDDGYEEGWG